MYVVWKLVITLMRYGSFRPWENEKGKLFPFHFDPNFSSWAAPATSTFFKIISESFIKNYKRSKKFEISSLHVRMPNHILILNETIKTNFWRRVAYRRRAINAVWSRLVTGFKKSPFLIDFIASRDVRSLSKMNRYSWSPLSSSPMEVLEVIRFPKTCQNQVLQTMPRLQLILIKLFFQIIPLFMVSFSLGNKLKLLLLFF